MMKYVMILVQLFISLQLAGQPIVKAEVSADTITVGETVEVTYTIENGEGKFVMPNITGLPVISGPNSASSMVYQQGKMSSSQSYSFTLLAMEEGKLIIPETVYKSGIENIAIQPLEIMVVQQGQKPSSSQKILETPKPTTTREKKKF